MSKIIFLKKYYFDVFSSKKHFEKQLQPHFQTKKGKKRKKKCGLRKARCSTHKEKKIHYVSPPGALCLVHIEFATPISF
jgi:DNA modification methylase